jgi:DNA-binding HxlR family transcriptional regulator
LGIALEAVSDIHRAGARILSMFANPLNTEVLRAHRDGPQRLGNLQERIGWAAEATIRDAIGTLREVGALEKRRAQEARNAVATALTPAGREMLAVPTALEIWLAQCPTGPISIEDEHVKVAVKALAEGWSSTLMRALAIAPHSLTELSALIPDVSYPSLERRIGWMRASGQVTAQPKEARGTPYTPTDWLRRSVAPLCVAGRCERRYLDKAPPITDIEVEAAFLLTLPLVRLPKTARGTCLLASRTDGSDEASGALAGTTVEVQGGEVASYSREWEGEPATWAVGTSDVWLDAVIDGQLEDLRIGGATPQLACDLVQGLNLVLFTD